MILIRLSGNITWFAWNLQILQPEMTEKVEKVVDQSERARAHCWSRSSFRCNWDRLDTSLKKFGLKWEFQNTEYSFSLGITFYWLQMRFVHKGSSTAVLY